MRSKQRDFKAAEEFFRKGVHAGAGQHHARPVAAAQAGHCAGASGDVAGRWRASRRSRSWRRQDGLDETAAKAHYSLGVLTAARRDVDQAIRAFDRGGRSYNPNYLEALQALGDALRRSGRIEASLSAYAEVVRLNPRAAEARFGYAMALVRLRRYRDAEDLAGGERPRSARSPRAVATRWRGCWRRRPTTRFATGLAPWPSSRKLLRGDQTTEVGETLAMAQAEVGNSARPSTCRRGVHRRVAAGRRSARTFAG